MTITVDQRPDTASTSHRGTAWMAECDIDGTRYSARSRNGAAHALARILVDAGFPDDDLVLKSQGLRGETRYRSFHAMAKWTFTEGAGNLRMTRYEEHPAARMRRSVSAEGENGAERIAVVLG